MAQRCCCVGADPLPRVTEQDGSVEARRPRTQPRSKGSRDKLAMSQEKCSGLRYATLALGIGILMLGILMLSWRAVENPDRIWNGTSVDQPSTPSIGQSSTRTVVMFCGVGGCLLVIGITWSVCVARHRQPPVPEVRAEAIADGGVIMDRDGSLFRAPRYEEVVNASAFDRSSSDATGDDVYLPSYDIATSTENLSAPAGDPRDPHPGGNASTGDHGKIRRIKSEVAANHRKTLNLPGEEGNAREERIVVEPLTPPPTYDVAVAFPLSKLPDAS
ncbi:transmembrane protein 51 [Lethenteron reissneri]|uniref:transmembrane protein 51 n=1 Tax=Lethenteron reissneri TaxID=7753 RepID=UPI002AB6891B|nr:transmembrane protein 51 [Lethenteron reissneri]